MFDHTFGRSLRIVFKRLVFVTLTLAAINITSTATAQSDSDAKAFQAVINAQVDAFRRDAWGEAFSYAAPTVRSIFGSPERFRSMVLSGYKAVARPKVFEFEEATTIKGRLTQPVFVVGPDGVAQRALYFMERQEDGTWKIGGVMLVRIADRTT